MKCSRRCLYALFSLTMTFSTTLWSLEKREAEEQDTGSRGSSSRMRGFSFGAGLIVDWSQIGIGHRGETNILRGLFDLSVELDLEKSFGLTGGTFFAEFYTKRGRNGSDDLGDIQGFSNIEGDDIRHFAQIWYEQWLFDDAFRIKGGKVDANSDFAFVSSASYLLNSSAGYSPSILGMPTYPYPAWSINAFFYPAKRAHIGLGIYTSEIVRCGHDDKPETEEAFESSSNLFWIAEFGVSWLESSKRKAGRLSIGPWYHTSAVERFNRGTSSSALGFYAVIEQNIWSPRKLDGEQGLKLFMQYGYGDTAVCEISHHVSAGLVSKGTFPGRKDDAAGMMLTRVSLNKEERPSSNFNETVWESFYRLQIADFAAITSDLQYILNPSGGSIPGNAWVFTLRLEVVLSSEHF